MQTSGGYQGFPSFYVYAILWRGGDGAEAIKIGHSVHIGKRLADHRRKLGDGTKLFAILEAGRDHEDALRLERALHEEFRGRAIGREWFRFRFSDPTDKRAFNDGTRRVLGRLYGGGGRDRWWTKVPVAALDHSREWQQRQFQAFAGSRGRRSVPQ